MRLLVVDDHFLFAQSVGDLLGSNAGYEVIGVGVSGAQALALAAAEQPDMILLDYHLPGYTADTLIPRLLKASPASKIVVLTSDTRDTTLASALRAGALACLTKDRAYEEVLDVISRFAGSTGASAAPEQRQAATARPTAVARARSEPLAPVMPPVRRPAVSRPTHVPIVAQPAALSAPLPPGWCEIRAAGIGSLGRAFRLEQALESLPVVAGVHLRDLGTGTAVLRCALRAGRTVDELFTALSGDPETRVQRLGTHQLELGPA